ncbi:mediator of RNA polymerase II transcription subunit 17 [Pyrus ussuriensis x Pyrus communis]|uniref:Mediator of RNA polymerase II transcription subunit 17 n=1 Tax=Pyrus ussuriensis x Pyrus communis TaxID=2448454 RepID=A0A5N5I6S3_9ROSA|nr:mediator of RNA polymerase II transcription subunit 17 [Pyrus ussuriensis x Pyrus communis]
MLLIRFILDDVGYDEKRHNLIRKIDFTWAMEKDENKKQKKSSKESMKTQWQWQSMMENLQLVHHELSTIIDLINTVETNNDVTVASMTRPKPFPNEAMSDLAYFKQFDKALDRQVAREVRFYGALIR